MPRPFAVIGITVFLVLSVLCNSSTETVVWILAGSTVALAVSVIIKKLREQKVFPVAFASICVACLLLVCVNEFYYYPQLSAADSEHEATMLITSEPEVKYGNYYCEAKVTELDGEKSSVKVRLVFSSSPSFEPYDKIKGNFSFYALGTTSESAEQSYKSEDRFIGAYPVDGEYSVVPKGESESLGYRLICFRRAVKSNIMKILPNDYGGLCLALMLGDRSELSASAYRQLTDCGITHIICVSGLHLSLWSTAILFILKKLRMKEKIACIVTMPAVVLIALVSGMSYSVIRSGIMMLIYLASIVISRRRDPLNSLGFALAVISASNPYSAGSVSLKLSALSTLGIILYTEYCSGYVKKFFKNHGSIDFLRKPTEILLVTCAAVGFCLPVSITIYGNFNFCTFPSNLLVVWAAELCMILSAFATIVAAISTSVINIPGFFAGLFAKYIIKITGLLSNIKLLDITVSEKDACLMLCGVFAFTALAVLTAYTGKKTMPVSAILVAAIVVSTVIFDSYKDSKMTVIRVFDSGNSVAVLVSEGNDNVLIGCGGDNFNLSSEITDGLSRCRGNISAIIIPENSDTFTSCFYDVTSECHPDEVICPSEFRPTGLDESVKVFAQKEETLSFGNIEIECYSAGETYNYIVTTDHITAAILCDPLQVGGTDKVSDCDLVICSADYPDINFSSLKYFIVGADNERGFTLQQELDSMGVNSVATAECGDIIIKADKNGLFASRA